MIKNVPDLFGGMVFNDAVMQARLPKDVYKALKMTMLRGTLLELDVAKGGQPVVVYNSQTSLHQ